MIAAILLSNIQNSKSVLVNGWTIWNCESKMYSTTNPYGIDNGPFVLDLEACERILRYTALDQDEYGQILGQ